MRQEATIRLHTSQVLNANQRLHFRQEAAMKRDLVAFGRYVIGRRMRPEADRVKVTVEFTFPTVRRRDRANLHATVKPLLDGVVKAGVLVDDSDKFIEGPDIVIREELSGVAGFVVVRFIIEDLRRARLRDAERIILAERAAVEREKALMGKARK